MNLPLYIARRYTLSRSKSTAINAITYIASGSILVSAAALFILMSVFSGLREFSLSFSNTTDPDLKLLPATGKSFMADSTQIHTIQSINGIAAISKTVEERVLFHHDEKEMVAWLKGVDQSFTEVTGMNDPKILSGTKWFKPHSNEVVVGSGIYFRLSLVLYNLVYPLDVYVPRPGKGMINSIEEGFNMETLTVSGVYDIKDEENYKYVYCDIYLAQQLLNYDKSRISSLEIKLKPGASETEVRTALANIFSNKIIIKNRAQLNDALYKMLNAENLVTYLFCSLVVVMTMFCLAGALIMLILDKKENIRTLYGLGAEVSGLRRIFFFQGVFITSLGAIAGLLTGLAIVVGQSYFSWVMITPTLPYPVSVTAGNIGIVMVTIMVFGTLASAIASSRVNRVLKSSVS